MDDLIECYRPFVDLYVLKTVHLRHIGEESDEILTKDDRVLLTQVINENVRIRNLSYSIKHSIDITVESFITAFQNEDFNLFELPKFC